MVGTHFMRNSVVLAVLMIAAAAGYLAYGPTPAFANQCTPGQQCADGVGCYQVGKCLSGQRCQCAGSTCQWSDDPKCPPPAN
jgi:hypothetical protein